jgi:hypothetical protein
MATPSNHMNGRIDEKSLLSMLERLKRENPAQATRRAVEYLRENSDLRINENPDGSFSVQSERNPDAPSDDPVEVLLFCLRAKIRRAIKR